MMTFINKKDQEKWKENILTIGCWLMYHVKVIYRKMSLIRPPYTSPPNIRPPKYTTQLTSRIYPPPPPPAPEYRAIKFVLCSHIRRGSINGILRYINTALKTCLIGKYIHSDTVLSLMKYHHCHSNWRTN